ncbi:transposase [Chryseobacterium oranimense]|uniref:transposase n=1 Tax=Chryseobacterium oranimense TaxID=421058 RepID=UPI0028B0F7B7|nr:transposase [Chryseobacterium oranimense]
MMNFKNINIGELIETKWAEAEISIERTCKFFKLNEDEIMQMFHQDSINTDMLLKWSKLLEYDFFRIYSQHLILFGPPSNIYGKNAKQKKQASSLPTFKKNLYTREIIDFILELMHTGEKTKSDITQEYGIPKTTLYKWIQKHKTT